MKLSKISSEKLGVAFTNNHKIIYLIKTAWHAIIINYEKKMFLGTLKRSIKLARLWRSIEANEEGKKASCLILLLKWPALGQDSQDYFWDRRPL